MKKIALLLFIALNTMVSFAQKQANDDSSDHFLFMGIPIDGTLNEFTSKLKQKGFTLQNTEDGLAMLSGDFASYKNCIVGVVALKEKDLVCKIAVIFPECDTWTYLAQNYFSLKDMLTEKYGKPSDSVEKFQSDIQPTDDNSKMYEVKFDRCKYYSIYKTEKGAIQLSIQHNGVTSCYTTLEYYDKINTNTVLSKAKDDL